MLLVAFNFNRGGATVAMRAGVIEGKKTPFFDLPRIRVRLASQNILSSFSLAVAIAIAGLFYFLNGGE